MGDTNPNPYRNVVPERNDMVEMPESELQEMNEWNNELRRALRIAIDNGHQCRGVSLGPGGWSGCTAVESGAEDCPACGPIMRENNLLGIETARGTQ